MGDVLKIGSVGTSAVMDVMQEAIRLTEGVICSVVYSRSEERGRAYADRNGVPEVCTDYDSFVKRGDVDVIYIASPNTCHVSQTIAALDAGKHVILEKPAALTRSDIDLIHEAAVRNHRYFFEAITTLFMPNYLTCRDLLPSLGHLESVSIKYGQYSSKLDEYKKGIISSSLDPAMKGGALNDMGIYCIHMAVDLFGEPGKVSYTAQRGFNGIDLEGEMVMEYPGLQVLVQASKQRNIGSGCMVRGENGYFAENGPMNDFGTCEGKLGDADLHICRQHGENRMIYELARFADAIRQQDDAFYYRMYRQSRIAAGVLEDTAE